MKSATQINKTEAEKLGKSGVLTVVSTILMMISISVKVFITTDTGFANVNRGHSSNGSRSSRDHPLTCTKIIF